MRDQAYRRHKEKTKQAKRLKDLKDARSWFDGLDERSEGHLKDGHFGCGCGMCKPWKHGAEEPIRKKRKKLAEMEAKNAKLRDKYV